MRLFVTMVLVAITFLAKGQTLVTSYRPVLGSPAEVRIKVDNHDNILAFGKIDNINGISGVRLTRIKTDGSIDNTFGKVSTDAPINFVHVLPNDQILIAGNFTHVNGQDFPGVARLNADGSIDDTFTSEATGAYCFTVQSSGKAVVLRNSLQRLNTDGSADDSFATSDRELGQLATGIGDTLWAHNVFKVFKFVPDGEEDDNFYVGDGTGGQITAILPLSTGKLLVSGTFDSYNGYPANYIVRIQSNGQVDESFEVTGIDTYANSMVELANGNILAGGSNTLVELGQNGALVHDYVSYASSEIYTVDELQGGKVALSGAFTLVNGYSCTGLAVFNSDYSLDDSYAVKISQSPYKLQIEPRNQDTLIVGSPGILTGVYHDGTWNGSDHTMFQLNAEGKYDSNMSFETMGYADAMTLQADGKLLATGYYMGYDDVTGEYSTLVRFNTDGSLDESFDDGAGIAEGDRSERGFQLEENSDAIYVLGYLETYDGQPSHGMAAVNQDGSLKQTFTSIPYVDSFHLLADGKILVDGIFTLEGQSYDRLRIFPNDEVDASFKSRAPYGSKVLGSDKFGYIYLAGYKDGLHRLHPDGSIDTTFHARISTSADNYYLEAFHILPNGDLAFGGTFDTYRDNPSPGFAVISSTGEFISLPTVDFGSQSVVDGMKYKDGSLFMNGTFYAGDAIYNIAKLTLDTNPVPEVPQNLEITIPPGGGVALNWDESANTYAYIVERATEDLIFTPVDTVFQIISYDPNIELNTNYYYRVKAVNLVAETDYSDTLSSNIGAAPINLVVDSQVDSQIILTWQESDFSETGFVIERSSGDLYSFAPIDTVAADITVFNDSVQENINYYYRVYGVNNDTRTLNSNIAFARWTVAYPPDSVTFSIETGAFPAISLNFATNHYVDYFIIHRAVDSLTNFVAIDTLKFPDALAASYSDTLNAKVNYYYFVSAQNEAGEAISDTLHVYWQPTWPSVITLEVEQVDGPVAKLEFAADAHVDYYYVMRATDAPENFIILDSLGGDATTYYDSVQYGVNYFYRIWAHFELGYAGSNAVAFTATYIVQQPEQVTLSIERAEFPAVKLSFAADQPVDYFVLLRAMESDSIFIVLDTLPGENTTFYDSVEFDTTYYYKIVAYNDAGSATSDVQSFVWNSSLDAPYDVALYRDSDSQVTLEWQMADVPFDGFVVSFYENGLLNSRQDVSPLDRSLSFTIAADTAIMFYIYAYKGAVRSDSVGIDQISYRPLPAPDSLTVTKNRMNFTYELNWGDNSDSEFGFIIERSMDSGPFIAIDTLDANVTTYIDIPVYDREHYYRVAAYRQTRSNYSNTEMVLWNSVPDLYLEVEEENFRVLTINWGALGGESSYWLIERSIGDKDNFEVIHAQDNALERVYPDSVDTDIYYYYRIIGVNDDTLGISAIDSGRWVTTPVTPHNFQVAKTDDKFVYNFTWQSEKQNEDGFVFTAMLDNTVVEVDTIAGDVYSHLYSVTSDIAYSFYLTAFNSKGESEAASITGLEWETVPLAPTDLVAEPVDGDVLRLTWTPQSFNEDGIIIERSAGNTNNFVALDTLVLISEYETTFASGELAFFKVSAYNATGRASSDTITVQYILTGTELNDTRTMQIYPQPVTDFITVKMSNIKPGGNWRMVTTTGTSFVVSAIYSNNEATIDGRLLTAGLYILEYQSPDTGLWRSKVMKK